MTKPLIVDAHEDLAYNILNFGRDYCRAANETRRIEKVTGSEAPVHNGDTLLGWPDYQRGRVAVIFSTLFVTPASANHREWDRQVYATYDEAHDLYRDQLNAYHELTERHPDKFRLVGTRIDLETVLADWSDTEGDHPIGLVPLMEGAEGVRTPSELYEWWQHGVRIIGPAWSGTRFCGGTRQPGPLTNDGRLLLEEMASIGFTLDISHMDEMAARQAMDLYPGSIIASHANAATIVTGYQGNRLLPDAVIRALLEHNGIIGVVPYCHFLDAGWKRGGPREDVPLTLLIAHVDHICQLAGDALHVGLGSDFDGGFGLASVPPELDTIADLQKVGPLLSAKGYNEIDVDAVLSGNWLRHLQDHLPK